MNIYLFIAKISTLVEDCLLARAAQPVRRDARVVGGKVSEGTFSRSSNARPRRRL
jgi:hypothetical protein